MKSGDTVIASGITESNKNFIVIMDDESILPGKYFVYVIQRSCCIVLVQRLFLCKEMV